MTKRIILTIMILFTPFLVLAHNPGGYVMSMGIMFLLSLIISIFLLKRISRNVNINNKFIRFAILLVIELVLLFILTIALSFTLGIFVYIVFFGGQIFQSSWRTLTRKFELSDFFFREFVWQMKIFYLLLYRKDRAARNVTDRAGGVKNAKNPTNI